MSLADKIKEHLALNKKAVEEASTWSMGATLSELTIYLLEQAEKELRANEIATARRSGQKLNAWVSNIIKTTAEKLK